MNIKLHPRTGMGTIQRRSEANLSRLDFILHRCYRFGIMFPVSIGDAMFLGDLKSGAADERKAELSR